MSPTMSREVGTFTMFIGPDENVYLAAPPLRFIAIVVTVIRGGETLEVDDVDVVGKDSNMLAHDRQLAIARQWVLGHKNSANDLVEDWRPTPLPWSPVPGKTFNPTKQTSQVEKVSRAIDAAPQFTVRRNKSNANSERYEVVRIGPAAGDVVALFALPSQADEDAQKRNSQSRARAAIEAMLEPTPEMVLIGERHVGADAWRAMIKTALNDGE